MIGVRKTHSKKIKLKAGLDLIMVYKTIDQLCLEYGVHKSVLLRWKNTLIEGGNEIFEDKRGYSPLKPKMPRNTPLRKTLRISHDGIGRCIDNVRIERFWRSVKYEDVFLRSYDSLIEARSGIKTFIEHHNYDRPPQSLNYKTQVEIYFS